MLQFLDFSLPTAVENVALDEALVVAADEGSLGPTLRVWEVNHHAVVLGASGKRLEDVRIKECEEAQIPVARRSSGGGTVLLGPGVLNFTVVIPIDMHPALGAVDTAQVWVLELAAEAFRRYNPNVKVMGSGDLTIDSRKFCGSAQRRLKRHLLVHACLINRLDIAAITRFLNPPARQPSYRLGRTHENFLTELGLTRNEVVHALRFAWGAAESSGPPPLGLTERLVSDKFGRADWIERL